MDAEGLFQIQMGNWEKKFNTTKINDLFGKIREQMRIVVADNEVLIVIQE